jgi:hypothetical protein
MKTNEKILNLVRRGFSVKTLAKLTESQINALHSRVLSEVTQVSKDDSGTINKLKSEKRPFEVYEKDGEMSEAKKKKQKTNPWAVCTAQMGKEFGTSERSEWTKAQMNKYERCVKDVKKQIKESENEFSKFLDKKIQNIVEKHIPPKMTKKDLLTYLKEQNPDVAPPKPKTKPDTKPGKPGEKPGERKNPFKNPFPGEQPGPKAKVDKEKAKKEIIDLIKNILEK